MARKFSQRHYRAIADTLRHCAIDCDLLKVRNRHETLARVESDLAELFASDSGKFKRDLFARACKPDGAIFARKRVAS